LRQLAKYGFVEPGPPGDNRERPWQVVSASHDFRAADTDGEGQDAVELLDCYMAEQALAQLTEWQERRADEDPANLVSLVGDWALRTGIAYQIYALTGSPLALLMAVDSGAMPAGTLAAGALAGRFGVLPVSTVQGVVYTLAGVMVVVALRPSGDAVRTDRRFAPA
jgi:hypothetical protein